MQNKLFLLIFCCCFSGILYGQTLEFRPDGGFKIVQFTDIHYVATEPAAALSLQVINETLDAEKPDLVIFTGDIVTGKPNRQGWDEVLHTVISRKIPYMVTFGNHDDEGDMNRRDLAHYVSGKSYLVNKEVQIPGVSGFLNGVFTIAGQDGLPKATLYTMDSHAYTTNNRVEGYGWFAHDQVDWYRRTAASLTESHRDTLPALAFFHIPLPEYKQAFDHIGNKRVGLRYEKECPPDINTGMFAAMVEAGDVMGTFVGHDHTNDYLVSYYGIALTYGACTRGGGSYKRSIAGARIIELKEGERGFSTYVRELGGHKIYQVRLPFVK